MWAGRRGSGCSEGVIKPKSALLYGNGSTEVSLITVHAHLQMSLGSDRLESRPRIIECSRLVYVRVCVCDHSVALRYPEGFCK